MQAKIEELNSEFVSSKSDLAKKYQIENGLAKSKVLARPEVDPVDVLGDFEYKNELTTLIRLDGYIKKQETMAQKMIRLDNLKIPDDIDYDKVDNLATEAKQKLQKIRPNTIGQASRISGINPSDIQMLMFHIATNKKWN
nr:hypothetical protein [Mycoplasmopsis cynos]